MGAASRRFALLFVALLFPSMAHAAWLEASSQHFRVYADDSERELRAFAERLERYHGAMAFVTERNMVPPSPSNRVTVFVVRSAREVRRLYGEGSSNIAGFYIPRASGSIAIIPQLEGAARDELDFSTIVLLHEYAHHFLIGSSELVMPRWLNEGMAEFFASARFRDDGEVGLGLPARHRAGELFFARDVSVADLLDPAAYARQRKNSFDAFYGKSWLLFHYLTFEQKRAGQLTTYLRLLVEGKSSADAGRTAFGDLAQLERELDSYLTSSRMKYLKIPADRLSPGQISVRRLSEGEAAIMPVRIRSQRGIAADEADALLAEARSIAARFSGDAAVLTALAEAEHDAGNDAQAIAAADAALQIDPAQTNAHVQKILSLLRLASDSPAGPARARAAMVALNKVETDHTLPLYGFFQSYADQGREPTLTAVNGLARAVELAPFDIGLRMNLADYQLRKGQLVDARRTLLPVSLHPHGGSVGRLAQRAIDRIDAGPSSTFPNGLADLRDVGEEAAEAVAKGAVK